MMSKFEINDYRLLIILRSIILLPMVHIRILYQSKLLSLAWLEMLCLFRPGRESDSEAEDIEHAEKLRQVKAVLEEVLIQILSYIALFSYNFYNVIFECISSSFADII